MGAAVCDFRPPNNPPLVILTCTAGGANPTGQKGLLILHVSFVRQSPELNQCAAAKRFCMQTV